jgi:RimJ/RimL family protein N-acetyltransferase
MAKRMGLPAVAATVKPRGGATVTGCEVGRPTGSDVAADRDEAWVTLRDGRRVLTRPIRAGDGAALAAAFHQLSTRSKQLRFGSAPPTLPAAALRHLVDSVDGVDHVAFAAFDDSGRLVGVARILRYPHDPDTLDVGMAVADDYQGAGLGHVLSHLLAAHRPRPAKRIMTSVASDNNRVMRLFRAFGATATWTSAGIVIQLPD